MASSFVLGTAAVARFSHITSTEGPRKHEGARLPPPPQIHLRRRRGGAAVVRAEAAPINPGIRKDEGKVVDSVVASELAKPLTAYCRCWRSGTFPLCDGSHVKHNKAAADNVGPLLVKK